MHTKKKEEDKLFAKLCEMKEQKQKALYIQEDLKNQILSQEDPSFIELVLMKKLGLVPESQKKIHFIRKNT